MDLRPYQYQAVKSTIESWKNHQSVLFVLPTGTGKTVVIAEICKSVPSGRRIMILAHRHELIQQLHQTVGDMTGNVPDIEQAGRFADSWGWPAQTICSSIQTQVSGRKSKRMERFNPFDFDLLVIDEAHHATAKSYRRVIEHYSANPNLKILGCTATPDRLDEEALGQIFDVVSFSYPVLDAISDGWLVPIKQQMIYVKSMNWNAIKHRGGDLSESDLAREMEFEQPLHEIVVPAYELTKGRKTLVFAPSVVVAERLCELFDRYEPGQARFVCGKTPAQQRDDIFSDYANDQFRILCNVGVATEGFDCPSISAVVMARPTQSRALYSQMAGRGMRPYPTALVNGGETPHDRKVIIAGSDKPDLLLVDLCGNSGRHKLASAVSHLGGNVSEQVIEAAQQSVEEEAREDGIEELDPMERLERSAALLAARAEEREAEERAKKERKTLTAEVGYEIQGIDPFQAMDLAPPVQRTLDRSGPATEKQLKYLEWLVQGMINIYELSLTRRQAHDYIDSLKERVDEGLCTPKQARELIRLGYNPKPITKNDASTIISSRRRKRVG